MTDVSARAHIAIHEAGFFAVVLAIAGLSFAQWGYASSGAPDWQGYEALYEGSADWLSPYGLAPAFMDFLAGARRVFGAGGYGLFRFALFGLFAGFAGWLAYIMPIQRELPRISALVTSGAVVTALLLKTVVQIREGLAFVVMLAGVIGLLRCSMFRVAKSGTAVAISPLIYGGVVSLLGVWLLAGVLAWIPEEMLRNRRFHRVVGLCAFIAGSCFAVAIIANSEAVAVLAASVGIEISARAQGGAFKIAYWAILGLVVWVLGRQAIGWSDKLAFAFSVALGAGLLPFAYAFCIVLVVTNFDVPAVTSLSIRILFTGLDLALIMVCLRGRANALTVGTMILMLADELRLLAAA